MKEMINKKKLTDKEWEELASILSGEKRPENDLLKQFMAEDISNVDEKWKDLINIDQEKMIDVDRAWNNVSARMQDSGISSQRSQNRIVFLSTRIQKIAAALLLFITLGGIFAYLGSTGRLAKKVTFEASADQSNIKIDLPDGSKVYLNRNSRISYRSAFSKETRNISLSGEAFFEIAHDPSKPFIIDAGKANVRVVGTSFNVITENEQSEVEVFVRTGKVILSDKSGEKSLTLDPGSIGRMNAEKSEKSINSDPNYLSWNTGKLVYVNQSLDVVFKDLKRVYNMDIVADDSSILENRWTSPIDYQPQDRIILLICTSFNLSYSKDGDVYHLSKK